MSGIVRLRLSMHGNRHHRIFHLVAARVSQARDSMPIEKLGVYDPRIKAGETHKTVEWSVDRIKFWLREGAQPTASAVKLLTMVRLWFAWVGEG